MRILGLLVLFQFMIQVCHSQKLSGFRTKRQVKSNTQVLQDIGDYILTHKSQYLIIDSVQDRTLKRKLKSIKADFVTIGFNGFPLDKLTPIDSIVVVHRDYGTYRHNRKDTSWTETIIYDITRQGDYFSNSGDYNGWTEVTDRLYYGSNRIKKE